MTRAHRSQSKRGKLRPGQDAGRSRDGTPASEDLGLHESGAEFYGAGHSAVKPVDSDAAQRDCHQPPPRRVVSEEIHSQFTRSRAFIALIATIDEDLEGRRPPAQALQCASAKSAIDGVVAGDRYTSDQSGPSQGFGPLERSAAAGGPLRPDSTRRTRRHDRPRRDPSFSWGQLKGKAGVVDHCGAASRAQVGVNKRGPRHYKGSTRSTCRAPRWTGARSAKGSGRLHPSAGHAPQQRSSRRPARVDSARGERPVFGVYRAGTATREWLATDMARRRFMHEYRKARGWLIMTPPPRSAEASRAFPEIDARSSLRHRYYRSSAAGRPRRDHGPDSSKSRSKCACIRADHPAPTIRRRRRAAAGRGVRAIQDA